MIKLHAFDRDASWVTLSNGSGNVNTGEVPPHLASSASLIPLVYPDKLIVLDIAKELWKNPTPPSISLDTVIELPFSLQIASGSGKLLPSSFNCGDSRTGGSVVYSVDAIAKRGSWWQPDIVASQGFPFVAVTPPFPDSKAEGDDSSSTFSVRKSAKVMQSVWDIFYGYPTAECTVSHVSIPMISVVNALS